MDKKTSSSQGFKAESSNNPLPFHIGWPLLAGISVGIALRFVFIGKPGGAYAPMMGAFIFFSPIVVGAVTVYVAETIKRRSWAYYLYMPFLANVFYVIGMLLIMIEGLICGIVIVPLFAILGTVGGLIMGVICRVTNWPKQTIYSISVLPLVLGFLETGIPVPERIQSIERTVIINAKPETVWQQINDTRDIKPEEINQAWVYRIGVPLPLTAITEQTPTGLVRKINMGKKVHFDQVFTDWQENHYVRWTYRFYEDSFPPNALDEHVVIGGHYFDFKDTSYTLTPYGDATKLKLNMRYRVSTQFNWYADPIAKFLVGNVEEAVLEFHRHRSERRSNEQL